MFAFARALSLLAAVVLAFPTGWCCQAPLPAGNYGGDSGVFAEANAVGPAHACCARRGVAPAAGADLGLISGTSHCGMSGATSDGCCCAAAQAGLVVRAAEAPQSADAGSLCAPIWALPAWADAPAPAVSKRLAYAAEGPRSPRVPVRILFAVWRN